MMQHVRGVSRRKPSDGQLTVSLNNDGASKMTIGSVESMMQ